MSQAGKTAVQRALRVLVVEDNLDQVHTLTYLLKGDGHQVDFAINATAAIDIARRTRPDVIFLDIGLPDGSGVKVIGLLRLLAHLEKTRIIAVTGRDIQNEGLRAAGFDAVLRKPVDYPVVRSALAPQ